MFPGIIARSIMCIDYLRLKETLEDFSSSESVGYLHLDIMDGEFVSNYTLGVDFCKQLRKISSIPLDIHLMVNRPDLKLEWFDIQKDEIVSVHYESTPHVFRALQMIKSYGAKAFVALNPGTPICVIENLLPILDGVLIMTVNPGFSGQMMVEGALEKISSLRRYLDEKGYGNVHIEVDGQVGFELSGKMREAGADIFASGTSGVYRKGQTIKDNLDTMEMLIK